MIKSPLNSCTGPFVYG
ncbi:hypothetical protein EYZ11_007130 [Aspergillus tanneri]|uniref:Uncharacterized protein n=1 Tax=Aspergillus tanneri TaxID=1220188 RepID=A0A4V3UP23_9EURO|nr:hypothetical protein EYZ11_007130 [Aspergillus tanneri]